MKFLLLGALMSFSAIASSHFECFERTGKFTHAEKSSFILVPLEKDLESGAILTELSTEGESYLIRYFGTSDSRTGKWVLMNGEEGVEVVIEANGLKRRAYFSKKYGGTVEESMGLICYEESSI